jgi:hypothetical protein
MMKAGYCCYLPDSLAGVFAMRTLIAVFVTTVALCLYTPAQQQMSSMPGMPMGDTDQSLDTSVEAMSRKNMEMGPHMHMTDLRMPNAADQARAQKLVDELRQTLQKYQDYQNAIADGYSHYKINGPARMKHFSNYEYAREARSGFNPQHPTSLLYEKDGDSYKLVGAMYTAPKYFSEDELDQRIPLSVAQWHQHVNVCFPPAGKRQLTVGRNPEFGLRGSISAEDACQTAGGTWVPHLFGWMVHVYPFETSPAKIWSVEEQLQNNQVRR